MILLTTGSLWLVNCAQTSFSSSDGAKSLNSVSPQGTGSGDATGNLNQNGNICTVNPAPTATTTGSRLAGDSCSNMPGGTGTETGTRTGTESENECDTDKDSDYVACILTDTGLSEKLGLVNGKLAGLNAVSTSVCVTKAECLGDVAKAFNVQGAYERGYCDNNPNVTDLTDAQVKTLLGL
jgi:hypothetical protein